MLVLRVPPDADIDVATAQHISSPLHYPLMLLLLCALFLTQQHRMHRIWFAAGLCTVHLCAR